MAPQPPTNWSKEVPGTDICLIVEGEQFFVGKYILASHSKYFATMFGTNFAESGEKQLPIPNKSREDFRMFLDFVHNLGVEFNMDTTWPLLEMGEYFLAPVVMTAAEEFLTSSENDFSLIESFLLADRFRLPMLMSWCNRQLTTTVQCKELRDSDQWNHFSQETQRLIETAHNRLTLDEQSTQHNPPSTTTHQQNPNPLYQYAAPNYFHAGGYTNIGPTNSVVWAQGNGQYVAQHPAAPVVVAGHGHQYAFAPHQLQYAPVAQVVPVLAPIAPAAPVPQHVPAPAQNVPIPGAQLVPAQIAPVLAPIGQPAPVVPGPPIGPPNIQNMLVPAVQHASAHVAPVVAPIGQPAPVVPGPPIGPVPLQNVPVAQPPQAAQLASAPLAPDASQAHDGCARIRPWNGTHNPANQQQYPTQSVKRNRCCSPRPDAPTMSKKHTVILRYPRSKDEVSVTTTILNVNGFDWKIETVETIVEDVEDDEDNEDNDVETWIGIKFTNLKGQDTSKWFSRADLLVELLDNDKDTRSAKRFTGTFTPEQDSVAIKKIVDKETIFYDNEFWKDGHCAIRVTIRPIGVNGRQFHKRVEVDWRENLEWTDCCIQVEDEKFFVGKATLVRHSKFFESIVSSDENPFVLKRQKKEDFRLFLDFVHRFNDAEINEGNVLIFIETASRLKAGAVLAKAETFLMKTDSFDLCKKIDLAHQYVLPRLKARCAFLIQLCSIEDVQTIMRSPNRSNWSSEFSHFAHGRMLSAMGELQAEANKNMQRDQQQLQLQQQQLQQQQHQLLHQHQWMSEAKQLLQDIFNGALQQMQYAPFPAQFVPQMVQVNQVPMNQPILINHPQFAPLAQPQQLLFQHVAPIAGPPQPMLPAQQLHVNAPLLPQPAPPQHVLAPPPNLPNHPVPVPVPAPIQAPPNVAPQGPLTKRPRVNGAGQP